jgi:hypothetical protein
MMTQQEKVCRALKKLKRNPQCQRETRFLHISSKIIRCDDFQGMPSVFVVPERFDVRDGVIDGVHWALNQDPPHQVVRVCVPRVMQDKVSHALFTLAGAAKSAKVKLGSYELDGEDIVVGDLHGSPPQFSLAAKVKAWADQLETRRAAALPPVGQRLADDLRARVPSFRWYRNVTSREWSGRVGGWQVCTVRDGASEIRYTRTNGESTPFTADLSHGWRELNDWIVEFARKRATPTPKGSPKPKHWPGDSKQEHLLESAIWRDSNVVPVMIPNSKVALEPVVPPSQPPLQFPALYSNDTGASARFVDAIMRAGSTPWVLEIKVDTGGQGQNYRHAITQAVLYREFLRQTTDLHSWFRDLDLKPERFKAAVVFPKLKPRTRNRNELLEALERTAACFDVAVVELEDHWEDLHQRCMK